MKQTRVATRYAKSLLNLAIERNELERVYKDMQYVATCCDNRDLGLLLKSPIVKTDKKKKVLDGIFAGEVSEMIMSFLNIIASKKRESALPEIADEFLVQYKVHQNIVVAQVTSPVKLSDDQKDKILNLINADHKGAVEMIETIDESLLGGFIVRIGDKQIDASINRKLNELRTEFSKNLFVPEI